MEGVRINIVMASVQQLDVKTSRRHKSAGGASYAFYRGHGKTQAASSLSCQQSAVPVSWTARMNVPVRWALFTRCVVSVL